MTPENYRALMRHQAGAVTVIAAGPNGARSGLTATAFSSLSDDPPTILACVNQKSSVHGIIERVKAFSVNILASDQQEIAESFAGRGGRRGEERFAGQSWHTLGTGAPVLADALASLDCELLNAHSFATHSIFIGRVTGGQVRAEAHPLLYFRNDYWDLGTR
jgi:flavin reductase (DIM6/NTAB) family NADH-FMN oxidoreductase RutF